MIVVVPARGGSKRLPGKNIHPLAGRPLLEHTLSAVRKARLAFPVFVSTDDDAIAAVAHRCEGVQIIKRPVELATDSASTESVLLHVLDSLMPNGITPEWIMTIPPTSPFRKSETIRRFAEAVLAEPDAQDCLMSVTENRGDFWMTERNGLLTRLFPNAPRRQQDRTPLYEENSAIYVSKVSALRETGSILGGRVRGLVIPPIEGFDINTIDDLRLAEYIAAADMRSSS